MSKISWLGLCASLLLASPLAAFAGERPQSFGAKDWVHRAFIVNRLKDDSNDARAVPVLIEALGDKQELVRGFALRALLGRARDSLLKHGGVALGEGLIDALKSREPYLSTEAARLLSFLAAGEGPGMGARHAAWRRWWKNGGRAALVPAGSEPGEPEEGEGGAPEEPQPEAAEPVRPPESTERSGAAGELAKEGEVTRERPGSVEQFFTEMRERGLEVVFVVDVTQSMADELARVREQVQEITGFFLHLLPKKVRLGLVAYDNEVVEVVRLTSKLPRFARHISALKVYRNPDNLTYCEGLDKGLEVAARPKAIGWLKKTFKSVVILGDAPPHAADRDRAVELAKAMREDGVTVNAIVATPPKKVAGAEPTGPIGDIVAAGKGVSVALTKPDELITRLLVLSFGADFEDDLRRFVDAYREVTQASG
jgi:Mg-chelatase subunit ChlD